MPEAKVRGYKPGRFSFNKPGGRCEACEGNGSNRLEMDFLADVWVTCPVCEGRRFNRETLQVRFKGKNIHDVLEMDVQEALEHFTNVPKIRAMLQTLHDVGLDYLKLGQPVADPLRRRGPAHQAGPRAVPPQHRHDALHPRRADHRPALRRHPASCCKCCTASSTAGNTVVVIEHNLDVIKTADWIIDLGPEGGGGGGEVVCAGTPEEVADCEHRSPGRRCASARGRSSDARPESEPATRNGQAQTGVPTAS